MNNLHRELAPISDAAWADIEEEVSRTLYVRIRAAGRGLAHYHGRFHYVAWLHPLLRCQSRIQMLFSSE